MNESPRKLHIEPRGQYVSFLSKLARRREAGSERLRAQFQNVVERGESPDRRVELLGRYTTRFLSLALFMVPTNIAVGYWEIQRAGIDLWLLWIFLVLFDVILLSYAIGIARLTLERIRNGSARIRFRNKTVRRGATLESAFYGSRRFKDRTKIYAYLRCVEERFVRSGRTQHLACFERFKSEKQAALANTEGVTTFRFDVPADAPASNFAGVLPTYWEVVATYEATGRNYEGVFLAPVEAVDERTR
jgi:hypothetical protein